MHVVALRKRPLRSAVNHRVSGARFFGSVRDRTFCIHQVGCSARGALPGAPYVDTIKDRRMRKIETISAGV